MMKRDGARRAVVAFYRHWAPIVRAGNISTAVFEVFAKQEEYFKTKVITTLQTKDREVQEFLGLCADMWEAANRFEKEDCSVRRVFNIDDGSMLDFDGVLATHESTGNLPDGWTEGQLASYKSPFVVLDTLRELVRAERQAGHVLSVEDLHMKLTAKKPDEVKKTENGGLNVQLFIQQFVKGLVLSQRLG